MRTNLPFDRRQYNQMLREEVGEWKRIERENTSNGLPWWIDLEKARMRGENLHWGTDPVKEDIVRGEDKRLLINLAVKAGKKALEIGCGSGWLSLELARRGVDVVAIDASQDRITLAKKNLKLNQKRKGFGSINYRVGDINEIDFPSGSFDCIVVWDALHHFPYLDEILSKSHRWLKADGKFITYDHTGHWLLKLAGDLLRKIKKPVGKIIPYENILGREVIVILKNYFRQLNFYTRLSFPVAGLLELFFSRDILFPLLPAMVKVDKLLCNSRLFAGECFFFYGKKK